MKVYELLDALSEVDPDETVLFDSSSGSLMLVSIRSGMHQAVEDSTALTLGEEEFLREMHILW